MTSGVNAYDPPDVTASPNKAVSPDATRRPDVPDVPDVTGGRVPTAGSVQDWHAAAHDAARLVAFGLRQKLVPARDAGYSELVRRYLDDPTFADLAAAVAAGLGLVVLDVSERAGLVVAGAEDSAFTVRMSDYSRRAGGEHRSAERLLHALAHLAVAALAFPRPADLTDDSFVGRVSVDGVDAFVREACRLLDERTADSDPHADLDAPEQGTLEAAWRLYARRTATGATRDARRLAGSTTGIVARAMSFLTESGCLVAVGDEGGGTYRTTARYQVQVRELAADAALDELLALGVVTVTDGTGSVRVLPEAPTPTPTPTLPLPQPDPQPGVREPGAGEPGVREPGAGEPGVREPGADEPGVREPGADEPGVREQSKGEQSASVPSV
jgi:hypothetical protein